MFLIMNLLSLALQVAAFTASPSSPAHVAAPAPTPVITDKIRFDVAVAQRNYLLIKAEYQSATEKLQNALNTATAVCTASNKTFSDTTFDCVDKPK
jgi:hypothetical protein